MNCLQGRTLLLLAGVATRRISAWVAPSFRSTEINFNHQYHFQFSALHAKAGSFFNKVPDQSDDDNTIKGGDGDANLKGSLEGELEDVLKQHRQPPRAFQPSTINGVSSSEAEGRKPILTPNVMRYSQNNASKSFVGIGPASVNDVTKPEYDDQGFTLYTNEITGKTSRVFEALVEYPCLFTIKIVGANDGAFVTDVLSIVATTCEVPESSDIDHSVKVNGKWTSVTVKAPVKSADMLYQLYENIDQEPRVKFKF